MAVLNAMDIDATFEIISLWNLNFFLVFKQAKNTPFIPDFLVILKTFIYLTSCKKRRLQYVVPPLILE